MEKARNEGQSQIVRLDNIDKKILHELDLDARTPTSKIARKLRINRIVADYRIKKMQDLGLIRSFSSLADPCKFGYSSWKVYLRFSNLDDKKEKQIIHFLTSQKNVWWVVKCYGKFDLLYSAFAESFFEFNLLLEKFHELFGEFVIEESINNHLEPIYFSRGYFFEGKQQEISPVFMQKPTREKIDTIDVKILTELGKDCRQQSTKLAKKLHTTPQVIIYRLKDLKKRKILVFNRLNLNVNKLGMDFYKALVFLKNATAAKQKSIVEFCKNHPYINETVKSVGEWQMEIEMEVNDFKHFNMICDELKKQFPDLIVRIEPLLLHEEFKTEFNFLDYFSREIV